MSLEDPGRKPVVVVGGGPAGLTAAAALAGRVPNPVVVVEREAAAGGIPRHSDHPGYGVRDLHRFLAGPVYARRLVERAERCGADIRTGAMVTGWDGDQLLLTSPAGRERLDAAAVVLATGARERPRAARLIPGDRPSGVYTTGHLQNLVHLHRLPLSGRAVVVGAELVSWSAVLTLRHAGAAPVLLVTEHVVPESYRLFTEFGRAVLGVPVARATRLVSIIGQRRVEAVAVEHLPTGRRQVVACDLVVLTGDWIPDHELARAAGLSMDAGSRGPVVDAALRTTRPGVFAIGNLIHPVDTADVAALDGRHVADAVRGYLSGRIPTAQAAELHTAAPLRWIAPGRWRPDARPPRNRLLAWSDELIRHPSVVVTQAGVVLTRRNLQWPASPGRILRIPASVLDRARPENGPITVTVV